MMFVVGYTTHRHIFDACITAHYRKDSTNGAQFIMAFDPFKKDTCRRYVVVYSVVSD